MPLKLRDYQKQAIDMLWDWFLEHNGNPCIVLPTGSGKSLLIAAICERAIREFPDTRILMCTHQKELIEQDYAKLCELSPFMDSGIYSAGIGRKELEHQVVFAGIQSIYTHAGEVGFVHILLVDEAHLINSENQGMYRKFIDALKETNPLLRVVGLTATPYRMKHGMITDKPALFSEPLIEPVSIRQLQQQGYLCRLTSKYTSVLLNISEVGIVAGEYNSKQLVAAVDIPGTNEEVVQEVIKRAQGRKSWLFFCSGVDHALHIRDLLRKEGFAAECVTGSTDKQERERILSEFKDGKITAVTNANVLTTGFDNPAIDLIVMLRPTLSPGLYTQMAGRGLRIYPGKKDCLVLDFAGNVMRHGPITDVKPPRKGARRKGIAPSKVCPQCGEIILLNARECPQCGYVFPKTQASGREYQLNREMDIGGERMSFMRTVKKWIWKMQISHAGNLMIVITYFSRNLHEEPVMEYLPLEGSPYAVNKAHDRILYLLAKAGCGQAQEYNTDWINEHGKTPVLIRCHRDGKYIRVDGTYFNGDGFREEGWQLR